MRKRDGDEHVGRNQDRTDARVKLQQQHERGEHFTDQCGVRELGRKSGIAQKCLDCAKSTNQPGYAMHENHAGEDRAHDQFPGVFGMVSACGHAHQRALAGTVDVAWRERKLLSIRACHAPAPRHMVDSSMASARPSGRIRTMFDGA